MQIADLLLYVCRSQKSGKNPGFIIQISTRQGTTQSKKEDLTVEVILFAITAFLAWFLNWETGDLLWSLWLSSLVFCVAGVFTAMVMLPFYPSESARIYSPQKRRLYRLAGLPVALFGAVFFAFGFLFFHFLYAYFIYMLAPLITELPNIFDVPDTLFQEALLGVVKSFWPFALVVLIHERDYFRRVVRSNSPLNVTIPFNRLLKMHLFIFIGTGAIMIGGTGFFFYMVIMLVFFFPWDLFIKKTWIR